jgi:CRISPR-associated endonuclease Csn1
MTTKTILGLDLGTTSIGWSLIEVDLDNTPTKIIGMGSRIIPLDSNDRDQFQKGQAISKNQDRTKARTQRKGYDRKQLKKSSDFKYSLKVALEKLNIYPSKELLDTSSLDLWELRSKAATNSEEISPEQLGRILYMLNQKRGYKSARTEANQDKKDTDYVAEVKGRYAQLKESKKTIGQYFFDELKNAQKTNSYYRVKEKVYPREAYIEEFDTIINAQKSKHPYLTDETINHLRNEIIFYQRKLKSQKGLVSICEFEGYETKYIDKNSQKEKKIFIGPRVAPRSSPLFQLCKIWETVNNVSLKIKNTKGSKYKWEDKIPTIEEKEKIVNHLSKNSNLSFSELLKILQLKKDDVYANKQILKGLQGNITYTEIHKIIGDSKYLKFDLNIVKSNHEALLIDKRTGELIDQEESIQIDAKLLNEPLYELWHTIYSIKDIEECKNAIIKRFNFEEEIAIKLSRLDFNRFGFGNKSSKAMRKILPYLKKGYDYSEACNFAGYNHSNSFTIEEREKLVKDDKLLLLAKNSLRQPIVEKILNQMINVVNALIETYGKPNEIRVELARELKQSKDERNDSDIQNSNNNKLNEEISKRLEALGLPATKKLIQKYKFIFPTRDKNLKNAQVITQCIYCGKSFSLTEALTGDNFDVDHIIPKSLLFDDSQMNKVLVHRSCNSTKLANTAYDYIAKQGNDAIIDYILRIDNWYKLGIISYGKMIRLKVSYEEYQERKKLKKETEADKKLWENFIERQLRQTQYISRKSVEILQKVSSNVYTTEGNVTAKLRSLWGWDDVLMNLQLSKYKELGQTVIKEWTSEHGKKNHSKEEIINWTKRDDHRHHSIDALVIACTKQGFIQRINSLNASEVRDEMNKEVEKAREQFNEKLTLLEKYLKMQKPFTTAQVEGEAAKILVSFKPGKKVATISKLKARGKNKMQGVIVPRGALHEQGVYGRINILSNGGVSESHIIKKYKVGVSAQDHIFNGKETYTIKKDKNGNEKIEDKFKIIIESIVDNKIREIVLSRLNRGFTDGKDYRSDAKSALANFKNIDNDPLWFNKEKGIKIISIKLKTGLKDSVIPIRKNEFGKDIAFVKTGSNHHIAIYEDLNGNLIQHLCTFWHAVERRRYNVQYIVNDTRLLWDKLVESEFPQSFIEKLPTDNLKLKYSLQENEMYILNLSNDEFMDAVRNNNKQLLSNHLFLVWSISFNKYWFRHHLETKTSDLKKVVGARESCRFIEVSSVDGFLKLNPKKVRLNHLGEIINIGV